MTKEKSDLEQKIHFEYDKKTKIIMVVELKGIYLFILLSISLFMI